MKRILLSLWHQSEIDWMKELECDDMGDSFAWYYRGLNESVKLTIFMSEFSSTFLSI